MTFMELESRGVHLVGKQRRLYDLLASYKDADVFIVYAHSYVYGGPSKDTGGTNDEFRRGQQRIGSIVAKINGRIAKAGEKIRPGDLKRTYRLVNL